MAEFGEKKIFYAFKGEEYIETETIPARPQNIVFENPQKIADRWGINKIDASFSLSGKTHLWAQDAYFSLAEGQEPDTLSEIKYIHGNWGNIPFDLKSGFDASLNTGEKLYLFKNKQYIGYDLVNIHTAVPYEIEEAPYEIIRLTASTAYKLNQKLFAGGISSLLSLDTQEEDELPTFSRNTSTPTTIRVKEKVTRIPVSTHLDFFGANGIYYWEMFFHAPFLIAQTFNTAQKFEEAKTWYEFLYDPTVATDYWKFLPFLAIDPQALSRSIEARLGENSLEATHIQLSYNRQQNTLADLLQQLEIMSQRDSSTAAFMAQAFRDMESLTPQIPEALAELLGLVRQLPTRLLAENQHAQIEAYLNDPFDPHAIANLRYVAYQKAVVMQYIDNLMDWGDMLFRQYTMESIDEARMLYVLAYDLLGHRPENLGTLILSETASLQELSNQSPAYEFLLELEDALEPTFIQPTIQADEPVLQTVSGEVGSLSPVNMLSISGPVANDVQAEAVQVHDSVVNPYFFIPENPYFIDYWNRVEDRLYKIRHCLNIDGLRQSLPLFQPPLDPAALVQAMGSGRDLSTTLAGSAAVQVPHYRFNFLILKVQDLLFTLTRYGGELLGALEKRDAEALSALHGRQEGVILKMTSEIKRAQLGEIEENLNALRESRYNAIKRKEHYSQLIADGLLPLEKGQIGMMLAGSALQLISSGLSIASSMGSAAPDALVGPFIMGVKYGGSNAGAALSAWAQASEVAGESVSMAGEALGVFAQHERMEQEWEIQLKIAESDEREIDAQIASAEWRRRAAQREINIHEKQIEHHVVSSRFLREKFTNVQLYQWLISKLSGVYYQLYKLTFDMARQAEKSFQFERGLKESEVSFIHPVYWDSQRKGLLAGEALSVDVSRMEKAYLDRNSRDLEISKNISLLELDPVAFLRLKQEGACEFSLHEALFDYDFPGHYGRQIKTISLSFDIGTGQTVMATLTQLSHRTVLDPDPKAVKYLLDPNGAQPAGIRSDWRPSQQVALSHHEEFEQNNGLFELRFDSDRYLPFEGTGAVSTWRLELNGKKGSYNVNDLLEVTIKLKYTAKQGGQAFADTVKGMLKPYPSMRFFDMHFDFPAEWAEFVSNDQEELVLPMGRELFPNMQGGRIAGIFMKHDLFEEGPMNVDLQLGGGVSLPDGKFLPTNGLVLPAAGAEWALTVKGDKQNLRNIQFVVSYTAHV